MLYFPDFDSLLIWIFVLIDDMNRQTELPLYTERLSNNNIPRFYDSELLTCAIFTELIGCRNKKAGHKFISGHYHQWFPNLPCYEVYNRKLLQFRDALNYIYRIILQRYFNISLRYAIIDTAPIVIAKSQHSSKAHTATPIASKGYCASKKMFYYGVKIQIIGAMRNSKLPIPFDYCIATASEHDLNIAKQSLSEYENIQIYADKAYIDEAYQHELMDNMNVELVTPIKKRKNEKQLSLFDESYNTIHACKRQRIEPLFAWIDGKTQIQTANKVRSIEGLLYHINVKMVAALLFMFVKF